jgi:indole-3-glycerol phosphate synthase
MTDRFVRTDTILDRILENTVREVEMRRAGRPLAAVIAAAEAASPPRDMIAALRRDTVALIAEIKRASPSRGVLNAALDPAAQAALYAANGAAAVSVLTDARFFQGHLGDLTAARGAVDAPVLRKDFLVDPYQVYEGRAAGADAVLLITAALADDQLADLHALAAELGMTPLVEVHDEAELERSLRVGPRLLGVNNRDLRTFDVDLSTAARLIALVPGGVTFVAESGIKQATDVRRMGELGAHAVLVGEALVGADDVAARVRAFSGQPRGPA